MRNVIIVSLLLSTSALAQPPMATETIHITQGLASYYRAGDQSFDTVSVGDDRVIDVRPVTDRALLIQGYKTGTTNIILFDQQKMPMKDVTVIVDAQGAGFVRIHNKKLLNSYTEYSCWDHGCQFRGETTVSEPAPLPRGYLVSTYNQGTGQQQAPVITRPQQ
jgi:hypothetical protein